PGHVACGRGVRSAKPSGRTGGDPKGPGRQPLPVHRVRKDHRRRGRLRGRGPRRPHMTATAEVRPREAEALRVVGRSIPGHDFEEKVQGALAYADDWRLPGTLHGTIVRAQLPSARIASINVTEARSLPGVRAVLTAADVPLNEIREEASGLGLEPVSMPVLAADRVRYQGEP